VFKPVIIHSAYSFILVHNHPSGDPSPSEAHMRLTRRILEASRILRPVVATSGCRKGKA
jgi:DNA repair protein RadC